MVECGGLENRCAERNRGFESLSLRHFYKKRFHNWERFLRVAQRGFEPHSMVDSAAIKQQDSASLSVQAESRSLSGKNTLLWSGYHTNNPNLIRQPCSITLEEALKVRTRHVSNLLTQIPSKCSSNPTLDTQ